MGKYLAFVGLAVAVLVTTASAVWAVYSWRTGAHFTRNVGVSLAPGIYLCLPVPEDGLLPLGAIVEIAPPTSVWAGMEVPAELAPLHWLKQVVGGESDVTCWVATAMVIHRSGSPSSVWGYATAATPRHNAGCHVLGPDELIVVGTHPRSYDSRYFGPLARSAVTGVCEAVWIWEGE